MLHFQKTSIGQHPLMFHFMAYFWLSTDGELINVLFFVKLKIKFSKLSHLTFKSHFKISINRALNHVEKMNSREEEGRYLV